jgi:HAD superfamily hydrolase (TIGR01458 family)
MAVNSNYSINGVGSEFLALRLCAHRETCCVGGLGWSRATFTWLLRPLASARVARGVSRHYDACMAIKGLMLDLDGTLYVGEEPVAGAREAVGALEASGLALRYVTNTSRMPRRAVVERLRKLGFLAEEGEVFTPAWAAARLIGGRRCLALVNESLYEDLGRARLTEDSPEVVLVGDLGEGFTYTRLDAAFRCLMEGAELVALQKNRYWQSGGGLSLDAGPFVAALEYASGKRAFVVGKPEESFFRIALEDMGLQAHEVAMVGDDPEADVAGAKKAGLWGIQVRTGKWRPGGDVEEADLALDSVAALPMALEGEQ